MRGAVRVPRALVLACGLVLACMALGEVAVTDDVGERIVLRAPARRIVSLAPHVTELLFAAGAGENVVGAVEFSDYPEEARAVPHVGGYSRLDVEAILALKPDLVVGWMSGNGAQVLRTLKRLGVPVFASEPGRLDALGATLEKLGTLAATEATAAQAAGRYRERLAALRRRYAGRDTVSVFYEIWNRPLQTVNGENLISEVIGLCGGRNVFAGLRPLAPIVNEEEVLRADPEVIVGSAAGEARPAWLDDWKRWPWLTAAARDNLYVVPAELIQRPTPRVLDGAERLCAALEEARSKRPR
jgi:iron complex transport system substrate-binding protein